MTAAQGEGAGHEAEGGARFVVEATEAGQRLDAVLARRLSCSRAQAQARIEAGAVSVDGATVAKSARLTEGARVDVAPVATREATSPPPEVPVRYRDEHLAVVAKPAGVVVHPGAGVREATLVDALTAAGLPLAPAGGDERPGIVHRLDRGTSGLLVVACTDEAHAGLVAQLSRREVQRRYWALVDGVPVPPHATVDAPIGRHATHRARFEVRDDGREAVTHYDVVEALGEAARLAVRLETGRTHQVRVHLAAIGHPVCGDATYGADSARAARLGLERPALHAERIAFTHPVTGAWVEVSEPPPADLTAAVETLRADHA